MNNSPASSNRREAGIIAAACRSLLSSLAQALLAQETASSLDLGASKPLFCCLEGLVRVRVSVADYLLAEETPFLQVACGFLSAFASSADFSPDMQYAEEVLLSLLVSACRSDAPTLAKAVHRMPELLSTLCSLLTAPAAPLGRQLELLSLLNTLACAAEACEGGVTSALASVHGLLPWLCLRLHQLLLEGGDDGPVGSAAAQLLLALLCNIGRTDRSKTFAHCHAHRVPVLLAEALQRSPPTDLLTGGAGLALDSSLTLAALRFLEVYAPHISEQQEEEEEEEGGGLAGGSALRVAESLLFVCADRVSMIAVNRALAALALLAHGRCVSSALLRPEPFSSLVAALRRAAGLLCDAAAAQAAGREEWALRSGSAYRALKILRRACCNSQQVHRPSPELQQLIGALMDVILRAPRNIQWFPAMLEAAELLQYLVLQPDIAAMFELYKSSRPPHDSRGRVVCAGDGPPLESEILSATLKLVNELSLPLYFAEPVEPEANRGRSPKYLPAVNSSYPESTREKGIWSIE